MKQLFFFRFTKTMFATLQEIPENCRAEMALAIVNYAFAGVPYAPEDRNLNLAWQLCRREVDEMLAVWREKVEKPKFRKPLTFNPNNNTKKWFAPKKD